MTNEIDPRHDRPRRIRAAGRRVLPPTRDAVIQADDLWQQHCSWCPRCARTRPGCELGRRAYGLYQWLARTATRRAGWPWAPASSALSPSRNGL